MVFTTTADSITTVLKPARFAEMAAASPHGPPPTIRRSTASVILEPDDLVAPRADAHVRNARLDQLLEPVEIGSRLRGQILESPAFARGLEPSFEPLIARRDLVQRRHIAGE